MKMLFLGLMFTSLSARGGPFVSGGMPGAILCDDAAKRLAVKVVSLGGRNQADGMTCTDTVKPEDAASPVYTCRSRSITISFFRSGLETSARSSDGRTLKCRRIPL